MLDTLSPATTIVHFLPSLDPNCSIASELQEKRTRDILAAMRLEHQFGNGLRKLNRFIATDLRRLCRHMAVYGWDEPTPEAPFCNGCNAIHMMDLYPALPLFLIQVLSIGSPDLAAAIVTVLSRRPDLRSEEIAA